MAMMCGMNEECKKNRPGGPCIHEWMMILVILIVVIFFIGKTQRWF
jgi:hypothetical protein